MRSRRNYLLLRTNKNSGMGFYRTVLSIVQTTLIKLLVLFTKNSRKDRYEHIRFPVRFLLDEAYLDESLHSIQKIDSSGKKRIHIDLSVVKKISKEALIILLAQTEKAIDRTGKDVYIRVPINKKARNIVTGKWEDKHIHHTNYNKIEKSGIKDIVFKDGIDPTVILPALIDLRKIDIQELYGPLYDFLVELIGNATEHGIRGMSLSWWFLYYKDKNSYRFVFVDMGKGIVGSYASAEATREITRYKSHQEILLEALDGKLGSSTGKENRGRGLPFIMRCVKKGFISDFVLMTNGVYSRYENGAMRTRSIPEFEGTYLSWKINQSNYIQWKNTLST